MHIYMYCWLSNKLFSFSVFEKAGAVKLNYIYSFYKNKTKEKYLFKRRYKLIHGDKTGIENKIKNTESTISVEVPINNMKPEDIARTIKSLTQHGFIVEKGQGSLKISTEEFKPHEEYSLDDTYLQRDDLVDYHLLDEIFNLIAISKGLGIKIATTLEELKPYLTRSKDETINIIIPEIMDERINKKAPTEVKEISLQILEKSNEGLILGLQFSTDNEGFIGGIYNPWFPLPLEGVFNGFRDTFNELKKKYGKRVSVEFTDARGMEILADVFKTGVDVVSALNLSDRTGEKPQLKHLDYRRNQIILEKNQWLLTEDNSVVIWADIGNIIDLLYTELKKGESESGGWRNKTTAVYISEEILKKVFQKNADELEEVHRK